MDQQTFAIPALLLQAIITNLEEQPARASRRLLNEIEGLVVQQQAQAQAQPAAVQSPATQPAGADQ